MNRPAALYVCLYARELPAQALLRLRPEMRDKAFAVLAGEPPLQFVCSCNMKARSSGVIHGMTRIEIETIPSVVALPRSLAEEAAAKAALLECAGTFSPRVEDRGQDSAFLCVIDIAGTEKLFGAPEVLAKDLIGRVRELGIFAVAVVPDLYERERLIVTRSKFLLVEGKLQNQDGVVHVKASHVMPLIDAALELRSHDFH